MTSDVDADDTLNESARVKSLDKANRIAMANDKGRLLRQEEVEGLVQEAQKSKAEDQAQWQKGTTLQPWVFHVKSTVLEGGLWGEIKDEDRRKMGCKSAMRPSPGGRATSFLRRRIVILVAERNLGNIHPTPLLQIRIKIPRNGRRR
ncbi:heat shock 70 kDa protein 6 isoform X2 [Gracilinanus agilis]|uniref:heat shock 70 kDa protein 6 isoform X2 n=1 Tax=Gracilinanus agilis TaxID=191870 RepID=UPI001CFD8A88|nr:heat shock 70 kDa protein 6 isoform X2 [Gracilinanus agilis]